MKRILVISDCHFPFAHPDWHGYLTKLKSKYKPTHVIQIGDETDMHSINVSHIIDPDLPSPKDEYELAKKDLKKLDWVIKKLKINDSEEKIGAIINTLLSWEIQNLSSNAE